MRFSRFICTCLCVVLVLTQAAFAGVHAWAYSLMELSLILLAGLAVIRSCWLTSQPGASGTGMSNRRAVPPAGLFPQTLLSPFVLLGLAFVGIILLQLLIWPGWLAEILSPQAVLLKEKVCKLEGKEAGSYFCLSLIPYQTRIELLKVLAYVLAYVLVLSQARTRAGIRGVTLVLVGMGIFQVLYGIAQTYGQEQKIWWWVQSYQYLGDVTGTYINRNHLAGYLELAIPMCLGLAFSAWLKIRTRPFTTLKSRRERLTENSKEKAGNKTHADSSQELSEQAEVDTIRVKRRKSRREQANKKAAHGSGFKTWILDKEAFAKPFLFMFLAVIMGVGLLLSSSRGGILALNLAMLLMALFLFLRPGYKRLGLAILCIVAAIFVYGLTVGLERTAQRFEKIEGGWSGRVQLWSHAWPMIWDYPVLGTGLGTFEDAYYAYAPPRHSKGVSQVYAHNDWLQLAIETGLLGFGVVFAGYVWFLAVSIRQWFRRSDPLAVGMGGGMIMALVSIGVHSLVDFNMHIPANALSTMVVAGLGWNVLHFGRSRQGGGEDSLKKRTALRRGWMDD